MTYLMTSLNSAVYRARILKKFKKLNIQSVRLYDFNIASNLALSRLSYPLTGLSFVRSNTLVFIFQYISIYFN